MHSLPASVLACLERADRVHVEGSNAFARPRTCHVYERACQCVEGGGEGTDGSVFNTCFLRVAEIRWHHETCQLNRCLKVQVLQKCGLTECCV